MKGLILCAGKGTRMRPITYSLPKQLIPIANKPVINYALDAMKDAGITNIGIVVSDNRCDIEPYLGDGKKWGVKITYIEQSQTLGIAHAVLCAEKWAGKDNFLLYLGDNLLQQGLKGIVESYKTDAPDSAIMLKEVPDATHFGVAVVKNDKVVSIEEKPKKPKSNLAVIGVYIFNSMVFEAAKRIKPSKRGELEITDTIMEIINLGGVVKPYVVEGWWKDTGQKADMIETNRAVLDGIETKIDGFVESDCEIAGKVIIEKGAKVSASKITGPVIIGKGATIKDTYIGPYTSIGENVCIEDCEIENSIVMDGTRISGVYDRISGSLIGRDVTIEGAVGRPQVMDLTLGDKSRLILP